MKNLIRIINNLEEGVVYIDAPFSYGFNQALMSHRLTRQNENPWDVDRNMWRTTATNLSEVEDVLTYYFPNIPATYKEE